MKEVFHVIDILKEMGDDFVSMDLMEVNFQLEKETTMKNVNAVI